MEHMEHFAPLMGYCDHQVRMLMDRKLRQYDVTPIQCRTLVYLHRQESPINQTALQEFLMVRPSTVNGVVARLEEKKLLVRQTDQADGRCRLLELTERGRSFYDVFTQVVQEVNDCLEAGFSAEELAFLKKMLQRIARNLTEKGSMES